MVCISVFISLSMENPEGRNQHKQDGKDAPQKLIQAHGLMRVLARHLPHGQRLAPCRLMERDVNIGGAGVGSRHGSLLSVE
jgi:hypothetical protein